MRKIDFYLSVKGEGNENEDCIDFSNQYYWIIDGATSVFNSSFFNTESDCAYVVKLFSQEIKNNLDYRLSLTEIIEKSLKETFKKIKDRIPNHVEFYQLPSFACVFIREIGDKVEYYIIGDCLLIEEKKRMIEDNRIKKFNELNEINLKKEYNKMNRLYYLQQTRMKMNQEDGYPILSLDYNSAKNGLVGTLENVESRLILMSDGLDIYFKNLNILECDFQFSSVNQILTKIYDLEEERIKTNLKRRDDISVLTLIK